MAGLKLQAVTKSWDGKTQVIQPLTLDVADGEFIVMVGPSGCGKSTLLRMVAGLERVTSGDIWIDRKRVTEMEPKDRGIAMVFQNYALYPHMSVEENMAWGLKIRGMSKAHIEERVREAARILELDGLLKRRPRELSGGQRSAWQWGARSSASRQSSYSTNRSLTSTPSCACRCVWSYNICIVVFVPPRSMLLTIR
ncbi:sn-Glycerol-3-phosphate transport ATP-binding protein [Salmonella enterica subsp. enterica]|uniref:sn-Glycerol-3-phosphate transport ATP-binding protein n=1 Tax=Salmonella enterica I TaxID=59201 RepID=A0A379WKG9_SALET|nr:sn-Glycerol-3-phosphate transport ATP-binding protein [Salmonella enterica subsp. enterica]